MMKKNGVQKDLQGISTKSVVSKVCQEYMSILD